MPTRIKVRNRRSKIVRMTAPNRQAKVQDPKAGEQTSCRGSHGDRNSRSPYPLDTPRLDIMDDSPEGPNVPALFRTFLPIRDLLSTETSFAQDETIKECLHFLTGQGTRSLFDYNIHGIPSLERDKHIEYLHERLGELPAGFVAFDAARPWLIYWTLTGLCLLGEDVDHYRSR